MEDRNQTPYQEKIKQDKFQQELSGRTPDCHEVRIRFPGQFYESFYPIPWCDTFVCQEGRGAAKILCAAENQDIVRRRLSYGLQDC